MLVRRPERRECRDCSGDGRYLRFKSNDRAIRRPTQEGRLDERTEDALARLGVEAQQSAGLSRRQPQPRHFIEFGSDPLKQCGKVHATSRCKGQASRSQGHDPRFLARTWLVHMRTRSSTQQITSGFTLRPTGMSIEPMFGGIILGRAPTKGRFPGNIYGHAFSHYAAGDWRCRRNLRDHGHSCTAVSVSGPPES